MNLGRARRGEIVWATALAACLASLALAASANAAFPGTNGKIAFVDHVPMSGDAIFTVNPDGSDLSGPLTDNPFGDSDPVWSADGQRIAFTRNVDQSGELTQVWVMNADGSGETPLTGDLPNNPGNGDCDPAFLSDGRVAFVRSASFCPNLGDIWVRAVDGTEDPLTSYHPAPPPDSQDFNPTSSPDGQTIAFARGDFADSAIYTVSSVPNMSINDAMALSNDHGDDAILDTSPNYSPDGSTIAFARCGGGEGCGGSLNIVTIPAAGGTVTPLTNNMVAGDDPDDCEPAYSPDGSTIVFSHLTPSMEFTTNCNPNFADPAELGFIASPGDVAAPAPVLGVQGSFISGFRPDWGPRVTASTPSGGAGGTLGRIGSLNGRCFNEDVTIRGTDEDDKIVGTPGNDVIRGFRGDDRINGKGGEDILCGGRGEDRIFGKKDNDILIGGDGSDYLKGGPGLNRLFGGTPGAPEEKANNVCVVSKTDTQQNCQTVR